MKGTILITDSLFIFPEHEKMLKDAGYEIERLDKPQASEDELIKAVKGKIGYILGGIEKVNEKVIDAADKLKAIVFTGIGYKDFIPSWQYATEKGIAIANAPSGPTHAVAEWSIMAALAMNRNIFDLGRAGEKTFGTTKGIEGQNIGFIGFGRIGHEIATMIQPFKPASLNYSNRSRYSNDENKLGLTYLELDEVLKKSDIVFLCVSKDAGENFIGSQQLVLMKDNALLVSFMHDGVIDNVALLKELESGRIRAISDYPAKEEGFKKLPLSTWYSFNGSNAFNTAAGLKLTSDLATRSIINLLATGQDENKVN